MKAVTFYRYGSPDVLRLEEIGKPSPKEDEILIKVHASSVNAGDWHLLRADPFLVRLMFGVFKPRINILGADVAGRIEAVGKKVTRFSAGDEVFGDISGCGFGAFAEFVCARGDALALKPKNLTFEEAAAVPVASVVALQGLRDHGKIQSGMQVLINGASGGVGSFAVQIAKSFGAEVTGVCSTGKIEFVRSLGADQVIDYTREDFTRSKKQYDLILAANGDQPISAYQRALSPRGKYVMSGGSFKQFLQAAMLGPLLSRKDGKQLGSMLVKPNGKDLGFVRELIEAGKVRPVIDRTYLLQEVPDAIRFMEDEHPKGKVVVIVRHSG